MEKEISYPILKTGNFYFPLRDIGKKFIVLNTYTLDLKEKNIGKEYKQIIRKGKKFNHVFLREYSEIFWKAIKKYKIDKKYRNCWLVPIYITYFKDNWIQLDVDILKPVKK